MPKIILPNIELLIPIGAVTQISLDSVETVLLTAEACPECLEPLEAHFRQVIIGAVMALEEMDDVAMYRLSQIAAVKRPEQLWAILDQMIRSDNERGQPANHCKMCGQAMGAEGCRSVCCPSRN